MKTADGSTHCFTHIPCLKAVYFYFVNKCFVNKYCLLLHKKGLKRDKPQLADFSYLRLTAILAHHTGAIHSILFQNGRILSGSDDMSVGVVTILSDGSLMLSKLLQGHVSRVRALGMDSNKKKT